MSGAALGSLDLPAPSGDSHVQPAYLFGAAPLVDMALAALEEVVKAVDEAPLVPTEPLIGSIATERQLESRPPFAGGVRVAAGDVNADGVADVIVGGRADLTPHQAHLMAYDAFHSQELQFQTDGPIIAQALFQRLALRAPQYGAQINYAGDRLEIYFDPAYSVVRGGELNVPAGVAPMLNLASPSNDDLVAMHRALNQIGAAVAQLRDQWAHDSNVSGALQSLAASFDSAIAGFQADLTKRGFKIFPNGPGAYSGTIHVPRSMLSTSYWLDATHQVLAY